MAKFTLIVQAVPGNEEFVGADPANPSPGDHRVL
jgi:hypothetical protein